MEKLIMEMINHAVADELFECVSPFCGVGALKVKLDLRSSHDKIASV